MTAHTPHVLSHPFPWSFPRSNSSITEVESRACKLALPIYGDAADCNGKEKDYESGFVSALSAGLVQQFMVNYTGIRVNVIAGCRVRGLNTNVRELSINYLSLSDMDLRWR
jgi:hypothetical protein